MKTSFFFLAIFSMHTLFAQDSTGAERISDTIPISGNILNTPNKGSAQEEDKPQMSITDYKIISYERDTTYFDTTLTIQKEYRYNYLRSDDFERLPFSNLGQTYTALTHQFNNNDIYPEMGVKAKHYNYMEVEDIHYYHVPTPTTELFFKTAMEQGQLLDAFITLNTSRSLNFSIAYKGLRSLGKYQHILSSTGNFRLTTNYHTKNKKYRLRAHIVTQDIANQENGGILDQTNFESGNAQFKDRSRIAVHFENAENILRGKRYYFDQEFNLFQQKDSMATNSLDLGHQFNYETKSYQFDQDAATDYFGIAFPSSEIRDKAKLRTWNNELYLVYKTKALGTLKFNTRHYYYNYFFKSIVYTEDGVITNQLKNNEFAIGGTWKHRIAKIDLSADVLTNISGTLGGQKVTANAGYRIDKDHILDVAVSWNTRSPDFNLLLYQSNYVNYNWQYTNTFNSQRTQRIQFNFTAKKWFSTTIDWAALDNYNYFAETTTALDAQLQPLQYTHTINYLKIRLEKEFSLGKFALNNTVMYQHVSQDDNIINVPRFITRNTIYYADHLFKKALYLHTGITVKYFTAYNANAYNPLIGEFYVQQQQTIGAFPLVDFFINVKVRQTRIYLKAEHFNSAFTGYRFYSAPQYPYRDFIVRFGLVWNFFL